MKKPTKGELLWLAPSELKPWKRNPRKNDHAVDAVARSIQKYGFGSPVIARLKNREVIAGHTRLKAAIKLGLTEIPVRLLDVSESVAHQLAIADNKLAELSVWDDEVLASLLDEAKERGDDLALMGFEEKEVAKLLAGADEQKPSDVADPGAGEPPREPASKAGEVYLLGPHKLICGDCRDEPTWAALFGKELANLAAMSPPYASQRKYDPKSGFKPIAPDDYVKWFEAVSANVAAYLASDGSYLLNIKEHADDGERSLYVKDLTIAHVRAWGWKFVDEFCWRNTRNGVPGGWNNRFKNAWEPVFHFTKGDTIKFRPDAVSEDSDGVFEYSPKNAKASSGSGLLGHTREGGFKSGKARPSNVIEAAAETGQGEHSAPYPIALVEFFVRAFTDQGDVVVDPFLGSGTTLIACARLGRAARGFEISPAFCDVIRKRWTKWAKAANREPGPGGLE